MFVLFTNAIFTIIVVTMYPEIGLSKKGWYDLFMATNCFMISEYLVGQITKVV